MTGYQRTRPHTVPFIGSGPILLYFTDDQCLLGKQSRRVATGIDQGGKENNGYSDGQIG